MPSTLKKIKKIRNNKSKRNSKESRTITLKQEHLNKVCDKFFNAHTTFEDKIEETFKANKIDFMSTNYNLEKEIIKNLKLAVSPSKINPQNDFYSYINDRWLLDFEVEQGQEYIVQVDDFRLVQDRVFKELLSIVNDYIATKKGKKATSIRNFYSSLLVYNTQEQSKIYSDLVLKQIDDLREQPDGLWDLLGYINTIELISWGSPFVWSLNPDDKHPDTYRCYIEPPQMSLNDINIYFDDGTDIEYKKKYRNRYFKYLEELFENVFGKDHKFNVKDIYNVEKRILDAFGCLIIKHEDPEGYNVVKTHEALEKYAFDWNKFAKALGFERVPEYFITSNLNYLLCGTQLLLKDWNSEMWRTYWIYLFIRQEQRFNENGHDIFYEFQGNFVRGQEQDVDINLRPIYGLGFAFNTFLTNEYIDKYQNEQNVQYVKTMAEDLKLVFKRIIRRNRWMEPKTKAKALKKLDNFKLTIGSPKILRDDPELEYLADDGWGNLMKVALWRHDQAIKLEGKKIIDIPVIDWAQTPPKFVGSQAYVVNAYYTPSENGIYIPLGYIQKPFVDLEERGIEYNLAHIGFTISHEMSHALDDWGSKYDEYGKLNSWWTAKDSKKFKAIQKDIIRQYETFALHDGIKFDAEPTIGENLADISGLTICREYLRDFQLKNEDILPIQKLSFETFFVYFAFQQRQKISKKALEAQLKTNPHPLDKYRTNVPLSRLPIFRTIYDIKKGDKMWWHSTNRVWED